MRAEGFSALVIVLSLRLGLGEFEELNRRGNILTLQLIGGLQRPYIIRKTDTKISHGVSLRIFLDKRLRELIKEESWFFCNPNDNNELENLKSQLSKSSLKRFQLH